MKNSYLVLFILSFLIVKDLSAQNLFQKKSSPLIINDPYVQLTSDSGSIICGINTTNNNFSNAFYLKTDSLGNITWSKGLSAGLFESFLYCAKETFDGGYILCGQQEILNQALYKILLIKINPAGNIVWQKLYGDSGVFHGLSVIQTPDSGFIVVGDVSHNAGSNYEGLIMKTDSMGNLQWIKSNGSNFLESVINLSSGGYLAAGYRSGYLNICKFNTTGNIQWSRLYGGYEMVQYYSSPYVDLIEAENGSYIISTTTSNYGMGGKDILLINLDTSSNIIWAKSIGTVGNEDASSVKQSSDKGFLITGSMSGTGTLGEDEIVVKTDSAGNLLWSRTFGDTGNDIGIYAAELYDGTYFIGGTIKLTWTAGQVFNLMKMNSSGSNNCNNSDPGLTSLSNIIFDSAATIGSGNLQQISSISNLSSNPLGIFMNNDCISTSFQEYEEENFLLVYPKPSTGIITLKIPRTKESCYIKIYSISGQLVFENKYMVEEEITIDLKVFPQGIYFLNFDNGEINLTRKIVKE